MNWWVVKEIDRNIYIYIYISRERERERGGKEKRDWGDGYKQIEIDINRLR